MTSAPPVFDGHNDLLCRLMMGGGRASVPEVVTGRRGHVDLPRARKGGFMGGFFAIWVPSRFDLDGARTEMERAAYDLPLPPALDPGPALTAALAQASLAHGLDQAGAIRLCTSVAGIDAAARAGRMAAVLHLEGAEPLDPEGHVLDVLWRAGLRSLGPVWSRPNRFGHGVPFRFPGDPDTGPGLTQEGRELIAHCRRLNVLVDISHLNAKGVEDVAAQGGRFVATHSNAWAVTPHSRNLTDPQLDLIVAADGVVGVNLAVAFLRDDGRVRAATPLSDVIMHLDHLIERLGEDRVALGSDFDGAVVPEAIGDVGGLGALRAAMRQAGYGEALIAKICNGNWRALLARHWSEPAPAPLLT